MVYIPGTDQIKKIFRITPKDEAGIRRGSKTAKALTVGIITGAASDPNFVSNPSRGSIVMAIVATSAAAIAKRNRVGQYEQTGYAEEGSSEELHKEALYTEIPKE